MKDLVAKIILFTMFVACSIVPIARYMCGSNHSLAIQLYTPTHHVSYMV